MSPGRTVQLKTPKLQDLKRQMETRQEVWEEELKKLKSKSKDVFDLIEESLHSIVAVYVIDWETEKTLAVGSGFFVKEPDLIMTNYQVVAPIAPPSRLFDEEDSQFVLVATNTGELRVAEIVFTGDQSLDLALLLTTDSILDLQMGTEIESPDDNPYYLELGKGQKKGDRVFAVGQPVGKFTSTVNEGKISAIFDPKAPTKTVPSDPDLAKMNVLQTDALINGGNKGGPLLNLSGRVVGINILRATEEEGINWAISSPVLQKFLERFEDEFEFE